MTRRTAEGQVKSQEWPAKPYTSNSSCLRGNGRLEPVDEVGGALRVGGGAEDSPLVILQDGQPVSPQLPRNGTLDRHYCHWHRAHMLYVIAFLEEFERES